MSEIPENTLERATLRLMTLAIELTEHTARGSKERDAAEVADNIVMYLIPDFEGVRVKARGQLDSGGLSGETSNSFHEKLNGLELKFREGYDLVDSDIADAWFRCIQYASGMHMLSFLVSGDLTFLDPVSGPVTQSIHGGKTWPP